MKKGTVKWFDVRKGYGFIVSDDDTEIFVHYTSIQKDGFKKLVQGQSVTYCVEHDATGKTIAANVKTK